MRWAAIVLGALIGAIALVALIGLLLPKSHVARASARYSKTPEELWAVITDFAAQPTWRSDLASATQVTGKAGPPVWQERQKNGQTMPLATTEAVPPRRLVRTIADSTLPFGGRWIYDLASEGGGTRLTITEEGEGRGRATRR